ncbi:MAG TPA: hypothetical protein VIC30_06885 [Orrella sp.]
MLAVNVQPDVKAAVRKLGQINGDIEKAAYRGINRALTQSKTYTKRELAKSIGTRKQATISQNLKHISANIRNMTGFLIGFGGPITVDKVKGTRELKGQNTVRVTSRGKTRQVTHAWKSERSGKCYRKEPNQRAKGISVISVPNAMLKIVKPIQSVMVEKFNAEFLRQINRAIKR